MDDHTPAHGAGGGAPTLFDRIEGAMATLATAALVAMMLAVTADASMRYLFSAPIHGTQDLVGKYLMVAAYFCILAKSYSGGAQVRIDILLSVMPRWGQHAVEALGAVCAAALFGFITFLEAEESHVAFTRSEVLAGSIPWPIWVTHAIVAAGGAALTLRLLVNAFGHGLAAAGRIPGPALPSENAGH